MKAVELRYLTRIVGEKSPVIRQTGRVWKPFEAVEKLGYGVEVFCL